MINTIIQGEALATLQTFDAGLVDAVIADAPYSSGGQYRGDRMKIPNEKYTSKQVDKVDWRPDFAGDNRDQRSFVLWCTLWLSECLRVAKPGAPLVLFTDWRQLPAFTDAMQAGGWVWRGTGVWDKGTGARGQQGRFSQQAEFFLWGSAGAMPFERSIGSQSRNLPGVITCPVVQADKHHITGKPTDLMRQVVKICEPGGLILDPFAGSGTTLVAAKLEGYKYVGIELTAHYAQVSRQRLGELKPEGLFAQ